MDSKRHADLVRLGLRNIRDKKAIVLPATDPRLQQTVEEFEAMKVRVAFLEQALRLIASGTTDRLPPYRSAPVEVLRKFAKEAIAGETK